MAGKTLTGFSGTKSGGAGIGMKAIGGGGGGKSLAKANVRPMAGTSGGVTSGGHFAGGEHKMANLGGKSVCCGTKGKGPALMPKGNSGGLKTTSVAGFTKSGLATKDVRPQPE